MAALFARAFRPTRKLFGSFRNDDYDSITARTRLPAVNYNYKSWPFEYRGHFYTS